VAFLWVSHGQESLAWQRADRTTPPQVLLAGPHIPGSWSPDGRHLAMLSKGPRILIATVQNGRATEQQLMPDPAEPPEYSPEFSPDGHWLAYDLVVSGRREIYVQPYPGPGPRLQVSVDGGTNAAWVKGGRELVFLSLPDTAGKRRMMTVDFAPGSPPRVGSPRPLFAFSDLELAFFNILGRAYDVTPDGQRFYVTRALPAPALTKSRITQLNLASAKVPIITQINLVQNWFEELKAQVGVVPSAVEIQRRLG
jgi:hypothetical protein